MHTYSLKTQLLFPGLSAVQCGFSSEPQELGQMKDLFLIPHGALKMSQVLPNLYNPILRVILGCQCSTVKALLKLLFVHRGC